MTADEHLAALDQSADHASDVSDVSRHKDEVEITDESDLADLAAQREADRRAVERRPHRDAAETGLADIRDSADRDPRRGREDEVRVPSAEETTDALRRAHRALAEIRAREADDRRAAQDARAEQLARWHDQDRAAEHAAADERGRDRSA